MFSARFIADAFLDHIRQVNKPLLAAGMSADNVRG